MKKGNSKKIAGARRRRPVAARDVASPPAEIQSEYPGELIRGGTRGRYAPHYAESKRVVALDPDIAAAFPDAKAVNSALRALLEVARRHHAGGNSD